MVVENISVRAEWDPEAEVWYVAETSLPGLNAEDQSVEELVATLPGMVQDLLKEGGAWRAGEESPPVSLELTAHTTRIVHRHAA